MAILSVVVGSLFHISTLAFAFVFTAYGVYFSVLNKASYVLVGVCASLVVGYLLLFRIAPILGVLDSFQQGANMVAPDRTGLKSILIPLERFVLLGVACWVLLRANVDVKSILGMLLCCTIAGSIVYLVFFQFSLNTAGRLVAYFRMGDALSIYMFFKMLALKGNSKSLVGRFGELNDLALLSLLFYAGIKFYFTIVSVGFFR